MTRDGDNPQKPPKSARDARLAAALRANLRRRKAQERGRDNAAAPDERAGQAASCNDQRGG